MSYILEHKREARRLEKQNTQPSYSIKEELSILNIENESHVLDAGCGSGFLSRYLLEQNNTLKVSACDASQGRLDQAKALSEEFNQFNLNYFQSELSNIELPDNSVDLVICRFVFEYIQSPKEVLNEFYRVLRPGGKVLLIDLDGVFVNIYSENQTFNELLNEVQAAFKNSSMIDLHVGRKLKTFLTQSNFNIIKEKVTTHVFKESEALLERENNEERFDTLEEFLTKELGSKNRYIQFRELYLSQMTKTSCTNFMNKFIICGVK